MSRLRPLEALRNAYAAIGRTNRDVAELGGRISELEQRLDAIDEGLRALAADERRNRRLIGELRASPDYELAWSEPEPLVTVTVATIGRDELTELSLPSVLSQSYERIEVVVAGDGAGDRTRTAIEKLGDERVRYLDLGEQVAWTDDRTRQWLVGATRARNAAVAAATGRWVLCWDDDDSMRERCVERLVALARESRCEVAYGKALLHKDGWEAELGRYPPREGAFTWAAGIYHAGLRFLERELLAGDLGVPGDWWLAERMLRADVRFAFADEVLCDVYPSERGRDVAYRPPHERRRPT